MGCDGAVTQTRSRSLSRHLSVQLVPIRRVKGLLTCDECKAIKPMPFRTGALDAVYNVVGHKMMQRVAPPYKYVGFLKHLVVNAAVLVFEGNAFNLYILALYSGLERAVNILRIRLAQRFPLLFSGKIR